MHTVSNAMQDFIRDYYAFDQKDEQNTRVGFLRFKSAMACFPISDEELEKAYFDLTGNSPYFFRNLHNVKQDYSNEIINMAEMLTTTPTSLSDLYNAAYNAKYYNGRNCSYTRQGAMPKSLAHSARECFKAMKENGFVNCVEIKTCGKCAIHLYFIA